GVYISFPQSARALAQWVTQSEIPNPPRAGGGSPLKKTELSIDAVAAIARAAAPEAQLARLTLPSKSKGAEAPVWRADLRDMRANKTLPFKITDEAGAPAAQPAEVNGPALAMRRLHDGNDQALLWRVIVSLGGLAPAVLGVTGIVLWLRRRALQINSAS
ncbi:MAG: PepSY domain-containing protein, partial [Caulobacterales bacterium]